MLIFLLFQAITLLTAKSPWYPEATDLNMYAYIFLPCKISWLIFWTCVWSGCAKKENPMLKLTERSPLALGGQKLKGKSEPFLNKTNKKKKNSWKRYWREVISGSTFPYGFGWKGRHIRTDKSSRQVLWRRYCRNYKTVIVQGEGARISLNERRGEILEKNLRGKRTEWKD